METPSVGAVPGRGVDPQRGHPADVARWGDGRRVRRQAFCRLGIMRGFSGQPDVIVKRFRNSCCLIKVARSGFPWQKTTKGDMASVYTNCDTAVEVVTCIDTIRGGLVYEN
jgi:hypothetical protein